MNNPFRKQKPQPEAPAPELTEAERILELLEQGKRATRRPMPQPKVDKQ